MVLEQEPNDSATQVHEISGEVHIIGDISPEDEDYFLWVLDEGDADKRWRFELTGEDGVFVQAQFLRPTESQLSLESSETIQGAATFGVSSFGVANADESIVADDESSASSPVLLVLNEEGTGAVPHADQLVAAGEYLIRVAAAQVDSGQASGRYQLLISNDGTSGAKVNTSAGQVPRAIQADRTWTYQSQDTDLVIPLPDETDPEQLWQLSLGGELGVHLEAWLATAEGEVVRGPVSALTLQTHWSQERFTEPAYLHVRSREDDAAVGRLSIRLEKNGRVPDAPDEAALAATEPVRPSPAVANISTYWQAPSERRPGWEFEPNDLAHDANLLKLGEVIMGTFHSATDVDQFQFSLPAENRLRLSLDPPEGLRVTANLYWHSETRRLELVTDELRVASTLLPPGDYTLRLRADQGSTEPYHLELNLTQPWADTDFFLLASEPEHAPPLPAGPMLRIDPFMGGEPGQGGWVRMPVSDSDREISWDGAVHRSGYAYYTGLRFVPAQGGDDLTSGSYGLNQGSISIPADTEVLMEVSFGGDAVGVTLTDPAWEPAAELPLQLDLTADVEKLAAFSEFGQQVDLTLALTHSGSETQQFPLQYHISHGGAELTGLPDAVSLAPGESVSLPMSMKIPSHVSDDMPVTLFVKAGEPGVTARLAVALMADAAPVQPFTVPDILPALQGLTNLAWSALGAGFIGEESELPIRHQALLDGLANADYGIDVRTGDAILPPIRLAGDGGIVHGIVINQRSPQAYERRWQEVEISLGNTADQLDVMMTIELSAADGDQAFLLDVPQQARYVQIRPLSVWGGNPRLSHGTGLLQVLGEPSGDLATRTHDLLDPELGGHWVYTLPDLPNLYAVTQYEINRSIDESSLRPGQETRGRQVEMVLGFLQQRAAMLNELHWVDNPDWQGLPVENVEVFTSVSSPAGPWQSHGLWSLERDTHNVAKWKFQPAVRARYIRLQFSEPEAPEREIRSSWRIPQGLRAIEAETLAGRASVLGYWGQDHSQGPMEAQQGSLEVSVLSVQDSDSTADGAYSLIGSVTGRVAEPGDSRHYRITLEDGNNTLQIELTESHSGRLLSTLSGPDEQGIDLEWQTMDDGRRVAVVSGLEPGEYQLGLEEAPRSVVFVWDGSASLSHHQPAIYQALNRFSSGLSADREVFNLMPLGGPMLIEGWATQSEQVAMTLAAYDGRFGSSDSEPALQLASRALESQPGEKAIFLIGDAEQGRRDMQVWRTLNDIQPRIYSIELANGGRETTPALRWRQQQMMSWSNVGGGSYRYATGRADLVQALEAGMRQLRSATTFSLTVASRYEEPPQPGTLRVVSGELPVVAGGVIHLIFDASGSMLRRMEGGRRIDVARRIVTQVLDERIPENVPIALRAFGHTEAHSCETELLAAPLATNREQVRSAIAGIEAINLARTPLAASLQAALDDLADYADQRRLLVMLTDGEETCDGDLAETVARLVSEGLDLRLNIVGFHIDDPSLKAEFERLAANTSGDYFDSSDDDGLINALSAALTASWRLIDSSDQTVARGRVDGEPVTLDPGDYVLIISHHTGEWRRSFRLEPQQNLLLEAMSYD